MAEEEEEVEVVRTTEDPVESSADRSVVASVVMSS